MVQRFHVYRVVSGGGGLNNSKSRDPKIFQVIQVGRPGKAGLSEQENISLQTLCLDS